MLAEVELLACEIAGAEASPEILAIARRISEAQIDLVRVREARYGIFAHNLGDPDYFPEEYDTALMGMMKFLSRHLRQFGPMALCPPEIYTAVRNIIENKPQGAQKFAYIIADLTKKLSIFATSMNGERSRAANLQFAN